MEAVVNGECWLCTLLSISNWRNVNECSLVGWIIRAEISPLPYDARFSKEAEGAEAER